MVHRDLSNRNSCWLVGRNKKQTNFFGVLRQFDVISCEVSVHDKASHGLVTSNLLRIQRKEWK